MLKNVAIEATENPEEIKVISTWECGNCKNSSVETILKESYLKNIESDRVLIENRITDLGKRIESIDAQIVEINKL